MLLILTGCSGQAALVRDAITASIEKPNYDYQGSLKLIADVSKFEKMASEDESMSDGEKEELFSVLRALTAGVTMQGSQNDLNHAKFVITANDDKVLRDKNLWTGDQKASIELLLDTDDLYVKTPIDQKYLAVKNSESFANHSDIDPIKLKEFHEKLNKLTLDFMKKYVSTYGFSLSHVKNHGTETVKLPNGESVQATHISVKLDLKELVNMFFYTATDATQNPDVRAFAIDMAVLFSKFEQDLSPDKESMTDEELRKQAEITVDAGIAFIKGWVEETKKQYTADQIVDMMKKEGLEAVNFSFDYYIDANKMPVYSKVNATVTFDPKDENIKEPITFGFESDAYAYNFGKAASITYPKADDTVTFDQLLNDENALKGFNEKGFLHSLLKSSIEGHKEFENQMEELKEENAAE